MSQPPARLAAGVAGAGLLLLAWVGPLGAWSHHAFAGHMAAHMTVVALAAPLLAIAFAPTLERATTRLPWLAGPLLASALEMVVVWGWHAPAAHLAARHLPALFVLEQATFLGAGLLVWTSSALAAAEHAASGIVALLFTSMHMTLLGALVLLSPRLLYHHAQGLADQQLGGALMLGIGGVAYLAGGLVLLARLLAARVRD